MESIPSKVLTLLHEPKSQALTLTDHNSPQPSPTQYVIQVHATSVTSGELLWDEPNSLPDPIPGHDLAGTIIQVPASGIEKPRFKPGDRVYALTSFYRQGNARSLTVAEEQELALIPKGLGFEDAASIPLSALSAMQGFEKVQGGLEGKRVLVTGASGAVGVWAVQIARRSGAEAVVGVCSGREKEELVRKLGATDVIDYKKVELKEWVSKDEEGRLFDVVFDCVGGRSLEDAWRIVRERGTVIGVAEPPEGKRPKERLREGVNGVWFIVDPDGKMLESVTKGVDKGEYVPVVDSVWNLKEYKQAFEIVQNGHPKGKVVLRVKEK